MSEAEESKQIIIAIGDIPNEAYLKLKTKVMKLYKVSTEDDLVYMKVGDKEKNRSSHFLFVKPKEYGFKINLLYGKTHNRYYAKIDLTQPLTNEEILSHYSKKAKVNEN